MVFESFMIRQEMQDLIVRIEKLEKENQELKEKIKEIEKDV